MAGTITYTLGERDLIGSKTWIAQGSFDSATEVTAELYTGLEVVNRIFLQEYGSAVVANAPTFQETLPKADPITCHFSAGAVVHWIAYGRM